VEDATSEVDACTRTPSTTNGRVWTPQPSETHHPLFSIPPNSSPDPPSPVAGFRSPPSHGHGPPQDRPCGCLSRPCSSRPGSSTDRPPPRLTRSKTRTVGSDRGDARFEASRWTRFGRAWLARDVPVSSLKRTRSKCRSRGTPRTCSRPVKSGQSSRTSSLHAATNGVERPSRHLSIATCALLPRWKATKLHRGTLCNLTSPPASMLLVQSVVLVEAKPPRRIEKHEARPLRGLRTRARRILPQVHVREGRTAADTWIRAEHGAQEMPRRT